MIGVLCAENEADTAKEFFELFKTPWEFFDSSRRYDVILSTSGVIPENSAKLVMVFSSRHLPYDDFRDLKIEPGKCNRINVTDKIQLPIYGRLAYIVGQGLPVFPTQTNPGTLATIFSDPGRNIIRVGYDLFQEISILLTKGQPIENALIPAIEIHISLIRDWIINQGISLIEIPPIPLGFQFFTCLTHDIDFAGIRRHFFDHTMWGFIYRGLVGSLHSFLKKRITRARLVKNWIAVAKLPLVYLRISDDFWEHFDRYTEIDIGNGSTYFLIPYKNQAGDRIEGIEQQRRAVRYDIGDIKKQVTQLKKMRAEIGLHGIDSWRSAQKGMQELARIVQATGQRETGNRVHWLFYDQQSPSKLEQAGFDYDATLGYNEAIGFKNGTTQVFRPLGVSHLLEIPLNIQDTALFFPGRMALSDAEAKRMCHHLLDMILNYHGVLTLSWHDRSLVPERSWAEFYINLLQELQSRQAWIGSAHQVVSWFRQRRSITFEEASLNGSKFCLKIKGNDSLCEPQQFIRLYPPQSQDRSGDRKDRYCYDMPISCESKIEILLTEDCEAC